MNSKHLRVLVLALLIPLLLLTAINPVLAQNDPGHDSLYIIRNGDEVTGNFNITGVINVTAGINVSSGYVDGSIVCVGGECRTSWPAGGEASTGWTNTSTVTSTALLVNVTTGNLTVPNGRIGIGTSAPKSPLEVKATTLGEGIRITNPLDSNKYISIDEYNGSGHRISTYGEDQFIIQSTASSKGISLYVDTTDAALNIDSNGNVGIGTQGSSYKLDVKGTSYFQNTAYFNGSLYVGTGGVAQYTSISTMYDDGLLVDSTNRIVSLIIDGAQVLATDINGKVLIGQESIPNAYLLINSTNTAGALIVRNETNVALFVGTNNGTVGIGTASPGEKLEVAGNINATGGDICITGGNCLSDAGTMSSFTLGGETGSPQTISDSNTLNITGGTGIDTATSATDVLTITLNNTGVSANTYGSSTQVPVFSVDAQGRITGVTNTAIAASGNASADGTTGYIPLFTSASVIEDSSLYESSGKIGLGSTAPTATLTINSSLLAGALRVVNTTGSEVLFVNGSNARVGIGTTSPSAKLDVQGGLYITGAITTPEGTIWDDGSGWIRTYGNTGWLSQTHNGGIYMSDSTWIRTYGDKDVLIEDGALLVNGTGANIEIQGGLTLNTASAKPTCDSSERGTFWYEQSTSGTDDFIYACMRNTTDGYNWIMVARGG